jgi:hypothetical protein
MPYAGPGMNASNCATNRGDYTTQVDSTLAATSLICISKHTGIPECTGYTQTP